MEKYCKSQEQTCQRDRKCIGTLNFCHHRCDSNDTCWKECLDIAKEQNATDYMTCMVEHDCFNNSMLPNPAKVVAVYSPSDCIKQHCPNEASACSKDAGCLRALQDCEKECAKDTTCWTNCIAKKGNTDASNFWNCVLANDCINKVEKTVKSTAVAVKDLKECA